MSSRRSLLQQSLAASVALAALPRAAVATVVPSLPTRRALVIGNDRYAQNPLDNAGNDARAMSALLTQAGFKVELRVDATLAQMSAAIDAFGKAAAERDVGTTLFYYAGHAAQLNWHNFLLPVDSQVNSAADVARQCVDLERLLGRLRRVKGKTSLIIIDACRNDPFGARFRLPEKGISQYDAPAGSLLAYATAPGRVALELPGSTNGLYTQHLVRELSVKGVRIEDALKRVRLNVRLASNDAQVPWESTSLESDVYLFPTKVLSEAELERRFREEYAAWSRIKASSDPNDWIDYLRRYPDGKFAEAAQARVRILLAGKAAAPAAASTGRPPTAPGPLVLGPRIAVPARFKGSGNPNSAGTYAFRPVWTPGDEYLFHELDIFSNVVQHQYRAVVKRVDLAGNRVEQLRLPRHATREGQGAGGRVLGVPDRGTGLVRRAPRDQSPHQAGPLGGTRHQLRGAPRTAPVLDGARAGVGTPGRFLIERNLRTGPLRGTQPLRSPP